MPPSRRDYLNQIAEGTVIEQKAAARASQYLRAAALQAEELTGNPAWDAYLTKLEAHRQDAQKNTDALKTGVLSTFNEEERLKKQCHYYWWCGFEQAISIAIKLPMELLHAYKDGATPAPQELQDTGVTATDAA